MERPEQERRNIWPKLMEMLTHKPMISEDWKETFSSCALNYSRKTDKEEDRRRKDGR